ncbi:MAG: hypothetical protein NC938_07280 [Candidatus Omnitrophica bacterium]|nr:hypothetical protein [Candidatus Omnitrophota bacterium]MCM8791467.1 hypothetical protein [Candidatus Omnitrophota bacterium]
MAKKKISIDWKWVKKELLRKERIRPGTAISKAAEEYLKKARRLARPIAISTEKSLTISCVGNIRVAGHSALNSRQLSSYLKGANKVHIFLVTIGGLIEKAASRSMKIGDYLGGYLLDRIGSLAVESLAKNFEDDLRASCAAKEASVSIRMSPGYCDWPIEEQFKLAKLLKFSRAGVRLNESCMMIPRKSISAIVGVGPKGLFRYRKSPCAACAKKTCDYRRPSHLPQRELR